MKVASPLVATCGKSSKKRMSGMLCSLCHLVTPCSVLNKEESMASVRCHLSCCLMCFALGKNNYRNCVRTFQYKYLLLNLFFFLTASTFCNKLQQSQKWNMNRFCCFSFSSGKAKLIICLFFGQYLCK